MIFIFKVKVYDLTQVLIGFFGPIAILISQEINNISLQDWNRDFLNIFVIVLSVIIIVFFFLLSSLIVSFI